MPPSLGEMNFQNIDGCWWICCVVETEKLCYEEKLKVPNLLQGSNPVTKLWTGNY